MREVTHLAKTTLALALVVGLVALTPERSVAATQFTYRFPVIGRSGFSDTHKHAGYPAVDIIAACGLPVVSPVDGVVLEADDQNLWAQGFRGGPYRGGIFVSIRGVDGVRYYGSHLSVITDGIEPGVAVTAGQSIGKVGRTGRAGSCHLHFGISPPCYEVGDWWIRRGVVWPNKFLRSWKRADLVDRSPRWAINQWLAANGCPTAP